MDMTPERWNATCTYLQNMFGDQDDHLASLRENALAAGLPDIAVSADVGRMLMMLVSMTPGRLAIEVGTLGGYSGIWIARGLAENGRLITIELEDAHADFAARQFAAAGVAGKIDQRRGAALDVLPQAAAEVGPGSVDAVFLDAVKDEYLAYWKLVRPLIAVGGLILADNTLGGSDRWVDTPDHPLVIAMNEFNQSVADDPDFEAVIVPIRAGVLIGRRMRDTT